VTPRRLFPLAALVLLAAAVLLFRPHQEYQVADLVSALSVARQQPSKAAFSVEPVTIDGQTRLAVIAREQTRLTYHVTLPKHAMFRVALALDPPVWVQPGDGVLFLIGVSDGRSYQTVTSTVLAPYDRPADRHWHEVAFSLEEYAGLTVDLILNTRAGVAGAADVRGDVAVWGAPSVVAR